MPIPEPLFRQISARSRSRGDEYFADGAVVHIEGANGAIHAIVSGTEDYDVCLRTERQELQVECACPYFADQFRPCKHVWAVILAADGHGLLALEGLTSIAPVDGLIGDEPGDGARWEIPFDQPAAARPGRSPRRQGWQLQLDQVRALAAPVRPPSLQAPESLLYVIDIDASHEGAGIVVDVMLRDRKANGEWGKPRQARLSRSMVSALPTGPDRDILGRLLGGPSHNQWAYFYADQVEPWVRRLDGLVGLDVLPAMCATGRCVARIRLPEAPPGPATRQAVWQRPVTKASPTILPMSWDDGASWRFTLTIRRDDAAGMYVVDGVFVRDGQRMPLSAPLLVSAAGLLLTTTHVARLDDQGAWNWIVSLFANGPVTLPVSGRPELLDTLLVAGTPVEDAPEELRIVVDDGIPAPVLRLLSAERAGDRLEGEVLFRYGEIHVPASATAPLVRAADATRVVRRDMAAERERAQALDRAGFRHDWSHVRDRQTWTLAASQLPRAVRLLMADGWHVEAGGLRYRQPGRVTMHVSSGIDWFDLTGHVDYDGVHLPLPALLAAARRGDGFVALGDGTMGLLPDEWLKKQGLLARLSTTEGDALRFRPSQAALLDALLAALPEATCDELFTRARRELQTFAGIAAADPPPAFTGVLRDYQRAGLGWMLFLRRFGFGGCLADDMGLGKTVMVLALLAEIHQHGNGDRQAGPSLVVAPRSLVFNWRREAERFVPALRVLEYTGTGRSDLRQRLAEHDVVLTTYGTVRRDAAHLTSTRFEYVVLDEAQAVKNASSASAKAVRLLAGTHRLALSGTPVENHLGELWSLFDFLNPGLLGASSAFAGAGGRSLDESAVATLARGLRPFVLRRTKAQVAVELPAKTEQTIYCELKKPQRALYDQLRHHYRQALLDRVAKGGIGRAKLQVLEALLRLRQAACHPGLIDPDRAADPAAKLEVLIPRLVEAVDEGHKTLVFSQFTSLLAILRARLDAEGLAYEYLDGRTRDRQAKVDRFQTDPECRLFLVSLKAGGVGLNLTAAEYVFLLDPWWNPAVEAQAIDRAHRIGQSRQVFAYRLIAKDTVEERVVELQARKRALADAIISADESVLRTLGREDLELLLS